jgi:hypothetical protein
VADPPTPFYRAGNCHSIKVNFMTRFFYLFIFLLSASLSAQQWDVIALQDLSSFAPTSNNWSIVAAVNLPQGKSAFKTKRGSGVLINDPTDKQRQGIMTNWDHGDMDLDVEVMLPPGSNSGIYLQGRYEVQLLDSWGKARATFGDMGGIYQRYDEAQQYGWEGMAPAMNAAKAPGLWQHLTIEFRAPKFNDRGEKIEDARLISVKLNGVTIHENVRLTGPTRGPIGPDEVARGPLFIQGDHGPVAKSKLSVEECEYDLLGPQPVGRAADRRSTTRMVGRGIQIRQESSSVCGPLRRSAEIDLATLEQCATSDGEARESKPLPAGQSRFQLSSSTTPCTGPTWNQRYANPPVNCWRTVNYCETFRDEKKDGAGKKRLLMSVVLRSSEATLTGDQADEVCQRIVDGCQQDHSASLVS